MLNESRIGIYNYLYNLLYGVVSDNVYAMNEPQELTSSDVNDGFIVIRVGDMNDESEFTKETYGWVRCYIEAFVPPISRGRLDYETYAAMEKAIEDVISSEATQRNRSLYAIEEGSMLSYDADETTNADNQFFVFIKSFIVTIDEEE